MSMILIQDYVIKAMAKQAERQYQNLEKGSININELKNLLLQVQRLNAPSGGKKKRKPRRNRFQEHVTHITSKSFEK
jgi:hypothetical protein